MNRHRRCYFIVTVFFLFCIMNLSAVDRLFNPTFDSLFNDGIDGWREVPDGTGYLGGGIDDVTKDRAARITVSGNDFCGIFQQVQGISIGDKLRFEGRTSFVRGKVKVGFFDGDFNSVATQEISTNGNFSVNYTFAPVAQGRLYVGFANVQEAIAWMDNVSVRDPDLPDPPPLVVETEPPIGARLNVSKFDLDILFSEPVNGIVTSGQSGYMTGAIVLGGPASEGSSPTWPEKIGGHASDSQWRLEQTKLSQGQLTVTLCPNPNGIEDVRGNDLNPAPTVLNYYIDMSRPSISSVNPESGSDVTSHEASFDITFSEAVKGCDSSDMELTGTAAEYAVVGAPDVLGTGEMWRFPVSGLVHGDLTITFAPDDGDVKDLAGNHLISTGNIWTYTVRPKPVLAPVSDDYAMEGLAYNGPRPKFLYGSKNSTWSIVSSPEGMAVDISDGIVSWENPVREGSPHSVTLRAQNLSGSDDVSFNISVGILYGNDWAKQTSYAPWSSRKGHASLSYNGYLWVLGGENGGLKNDVWKYNKTEGWIQVTEAAEWSARSNHAVLVFDGKIWLLGGKDAVSERNDVWYSENGETWTKVMQSASFDKCYDHEGLVFNGKMWIIGGRDYKGDPTSKIWSSSDGASWSEVNASNIPWDARYGHACLLYNASMWVIGGRCDSGNMNDVWSSADGVNWSLATDNAEYSNRSGHAALTYDGLMWILGGDWNNSKMNDVWYSSNGETWHRVLDSADWYGRRYHSAAVYNEKMWILGGERTYELRDVWHSRIPGPPVIEDIPDETIPEGFFNYSGPYPVLDRGSQPVKWSLMEGPEGMNINEETGRVWLIDVTADGSPFTITIRAQNKYGSDEESWILNVEESAPSIRPIDNKSIYEGEPYSGLRPTLEYGSPTIEWSLISGPEDMTINESNGVVAWNEPTTEGSPHFIAIRASNHIGSDTESWYLTVKPFLTPKIVEIPDDSALENEPYVSEKFSLIQGTSPVTWSLTKGPEGMILFKYEGYVSWDNPVVAADPYEIIVRAENRAGFDEKSWLLTVESGETPVIEEIPDSRVFQGNEFRYQARCVSGTEPFTWEITEAPPGMTVESETGLILWPEAGNGGTTYTATLRASNKFGFDEEIIRVYVMKKRAHRWKRSEGLILWNGREGADSVVFNDNLWIIGGRRDTDYYYNDVWKSPDGIQWIPATLSAPWKSRYDHQCVVFNDKIWLLGGGGLSSHQEFYNDVWHSSDGVNWTQETAEAPWPERLGHAAVVHDGKIWIMGGRNNDGQIMDVWSSVNGSDWVQVTSSAGWQERSGLEAASLHGRLWIFGGSLKISENDVWSSEDGKEWAEVTGSAAWGERTNAKVLVHDGSFWLFGGRGNAILYNDVWNSQNGKDWREMTSVASWDVREQHCAQYFKDVFWVFAGRNGDNPSMNDVWRSLDDGPPEIWPVKPRSLVHNVEFTAPAPLLKNGTEPVTWSLSNPEEGMTVNSETGVVTWASPSPAGENASCMLCAENAFGSGSLALNFEVTPLMGDKWIKKRESAEWDPRQGHVSLVFNEKIWIMGGYEYNDEADYKNDVWSSENGTSWTLVTSSAQWTGRRYHAAAVFADKMWIIGGQTSYRDFLSDVWCSEDGENWTQTATLPGPSGAGAAAVAFDNKLWVMGGRYYNGSTTVRLDHIYRSANGTEWTQVTTSAPWGPRTYFNLAVFDDKMWLMAGYTSLGAQNDVWYSEDGSLWVQPLQTAPWEERASAFLFVHDSKMWLLGGDGKEDLWYSDDGLLWNEIPVLEGWISRTSFASVLFRKRFWIFGGRHSYHGNNEVYCTALDIPKDEAMNMARSLILHIREMSSEEKKALDFNNDGIIDVSDIVYLLKNLN